MSSVQGNQSVDRVGSGIGDYVFQMRRSIGSLLFGGLLVAICGCASEAPPRPPEVAAGIAAPNVAEVPSTSAPLETPEEPFQPPYPNRTELFIPPDLTHFAHLPDRVDGPSVAVRGFMSLDGQRVVLEINGAVHILAEGEQEGGVEVVSIAPPRVVLQRRGERWTAQMLRSR
jgi:hypothetical protein